MESPEVEATMALVREFGQRLDRIEERFKPYWTGGRIFMLTLYNIVGIALIANGVSHPGALGVVKLLLGAVVVSLFALGALWVRRKP